MYSIFSFTLHRRTQDFTMEGFHRAPVGPGIFQKGSEL